MCGGNWKRNENVTRQSTGSFPLACSFSIYKTVLLRRVKRNNTQDRQYTVVLLYQHNSVLSVLCIVTFHPAQQNSFVSSFMYVVRPHVEYCVSAWSSYYKKDEELLEKVQRRFTKTIKGMKGMSCEERLQKLKLWSWKKEEIDRT